MATRDEPGVGRIVLVLAAFLVVGIPMVAIGWNAVNLALAGDLRQLLVAVPLVLLFAGFLVLFGRRLQRLERR